MVRFLKFYLVLLAVLAPYWFMAALLIAPFFNANSGGADEAKHIVTWAMVSFVMAMIIFAYFSGVIKAMIPGGVKSKLDLLSTKAFDWIES